MGKQTGLTNERELVSKVTEWFNEPLQSNKLSIKEANNVMTK